MGLGSGAYLMAGFDVVEKMVGPDELSNAVSFMAIGTSSTHSYPNRHAFNSILKKTGLRHNTNIKTSPATAQDIGLILLLALAGSIYQNTTTARLRPLLASSSSGEAADVDILLAGTSNDAFQSLRPESLKADVVREVTRGIGGVWALLMAAAAVSLVAALGLGNGSVYGREKGVGEATGDGREKGEG